MRRPANLRKAEIVATVLDMADRIGPDRVTTNAVAQQIGLTQGALFRHFPSKSDMWGAVADHVADLLSQTWERALAGRTDPLARIRALIGAQLGVIAQNPAIPMLLFSRELTTENEALRGTFRARLGAFHGLLQADIAAAQDAGQITTAPDPRDIAYLLSSLVQGAAIRWALGPRDTALDRAGLTLLEVQLQLLSAQKER